MKEQQIIKQFEEEFWDKENGRFKNPASIDSMLDFLLSKLEEQRKGYIAMLKDMIKPEIVNSINGSGWTSMVAQEAFNDALYKAINLIKKDNGGKNG